MPRYSVSASVEVREVGQEALLSVLGGVTIEVGDDDLAHPGQIVRSVGNALVGQPAFPTPPTKEKEPEENCEWCGKRYPKSEMNSIAWGGDPNRIKRICDRCCDEGN